MEEHVGGDEPAAEAAITMVHDALRRDVAFMNAAGVFHFDAHLGNILTDGHCLYLADFGLATSPRYELTAAGKKANVCVVVSDLFAAYQTGGALINRALENAKQELGRAERTITPVDLAANEIYDILRKRLFLSIPDQAEIDDIADAYGKKLAEAAKSKVASRGAEAIADEISATYPFHPRLKNVIALFKENEQFKQTRGLIELVSRLLKSVWSRNANDVFLIGPQHFDLAVPEVRDKLTEISGMRDVMAKDLWDVQQSAHAQIIDLQTCKEAATQVGALLLTASLSTAVNAVKGLTSV